MKFLWLISGFSVLITNAMIETRAMKKRRFTPEISSENSQQVGEPQSMTLGAQLSRLPDNVLQNIACLRIEEQAKQDFFSICTDSEFKIESIVHDCCLPNWIPMKRLSLGLMKNTYRIERFTALAEEFGWSRLLFYAMRSNQLSLIKLFPLRDINVAGPLCIDLLHIAIYSRNMEIVEYLVEQGISLVGGGWRGRNSLHAAVIAGDPRLVAFIIKYTGNTFQSLNTRDTEGNSVLDTAIFCDRFGHSANSKEIIRLLQNIAQ